MSYNTISISFAIFVLLYAAANPVAKATLLQRELRVSGRLCCTTTGNCNATSAGVEGAVVSLNCPTSILGPVSIVGQGTTAATGNFTITANIRSLLTLARCFVRVPLPLTGAAAVSCPQLANATTATGSLRSSLRVLSITGSILARVTNAEVVMFSRA